MEHGHVAEPCRVWLVEVEACSAVSEHGSFTSMIDERDDCSGCSGSAHGRHVDAFGVEFVDQRSTNRICADLADEACSVTKVRGH